MRPPEDDRYEARSTHAPGLASKEANEYSVMCPFSRALINARSLPSELSRERGSKLEAGYRLASIATGQPGLAGTSEFIQRFILLK